MANKSITLQPGFHFTASNTATYTGTIVSDEAQHIGNPGAAGYAGVFSGLPISVTKEDALQGVTTTQTIAYDLYNNPLSTTNSFPGGSKTKTYAYSHNASATDHTYHIGRPTKITESNILGSESFSTEQEMTYANNLVATHQKKGNGDTGYITETFAYDTFGNVLTKTLSATGIPSRTESFEYDTSGRFLTKSTDIEGLETKYTYNYDNGNPLTVTNPYGLTTTYAYDGWGRLLSETNYLGKSSSYAYHATSIDGNWALAKTTDFADGGQTSSYYNAFGWLVQSKALSLNDTYVYKSYEHDAIGRTIGESEPYFENDTKQWNTFAFDDVGRPITQTLYTGKVVNTTFNGLTVTVDDGTKTVSSTKNAVGNIVQMTDPGGTINYTYYANGSMKQANYGSHIVNTEIDGWGRKTKLNDPSAGEYTYTYTILGEILTEATPKGTTTYSYDAYGKLTNKSIQGDLTDLSLRYAYDPSSKLLTSTTGTDGIENKNYNYQYAYDAYKRPTSVQELTNTANFEKQLTYDAFGRIATERYSSDHTASTTNSTITVQNVFDAAGILTELKDASNNSSLWKITQENARGQATSISLGNGITKAKTYDAYGFLTNISDTKTGVDALKMDYAFDTQRGNLSSRTNHAFANWTENFTYDSQDRLTAIAGATTHTQSYDTKGRIEENSWVGAYSYNHSKQYQLSEVDLNTQGDLHYQNHAPQQITYNAFKKPVSIYEEGNGRVDFEYGPLQNRTHAYYGGLQSDKTQRQYHKQYSSILPIEMIEDTTDGNIKIISYIGGDGYTAPIAYIKQTGSNAIDEYHYLHRDYLGSILAITDSSGAVKEQRQFGAWGQADKFVDSDGNTTFTHSSLIGRGYTGHEHFFEVNLIHMNGRMYDANLGRFLSPDNYIQDPFNTQSFNRYGYVLNNPLKYVDPSGEWLWIVGAIIGAWIGGSKANGGNLNPLQWDWTSLDTWKGIVVGGIVGALTGQSLTNVTGFGGNSFAGGESLWSNLGLTELLGGAAFAAASLYDTGFYWGGSDKEKGVGNDPPVDGGRERLEGSSDTDNWWSNVKTAAQLTWEWDQGVGDPNRTFVNDRVANSFRNAWKVNEARNAWYREANTGRDMVNTPYTGHGGSFGLEGLLRAGIDPIEQFAGGYRIESIHVEGDYLRFKLTNRTSMNSFLYDQGPEWERKTFGLNGNTYQNYIFTESINYNRLKR